MKKSPTRTPFRHLRHAAALTAIAFAAIMLAAACTDTDAIDTDDDAQALSFYAILPAPVPAGESIASPADACADASAASPATTRATTRATNKTAFAEGDLIAVRIDSEVKPYTCDANGHFTSPAPFYRTPGAQQQVCAWYPYTLPTAEAPLNLSDQTTDDAFAAADFLFSGPADLVRATPTLTFTHRTALLRLNIKADGKTLPTTPQVTGVQIENTYPQATANPDNGTLTGLGNTGTILAHPCATLATGYAATYEALIVPHDIPLYPASPGTTITVSTGMGSNAKTYTGTITTGSYRPGHVHTYNVILSTDRMSISPATSDMPWAEGIAAPEGYDLTVSNALELQAFAQAVNSGGKIGNTNIPARKARVLQIADIDLGEIADWTPIGNNDYSGHNYSFQGAYNGNGYTISRLKSNWEGIDIGLFGNVVGTDTNTPAVLTGIHLREAEISTTTKSKYCSAGLIVGYTEKAVISFCTAQGEISVTATEASSLVGGIIGNANSNTVINHCRTNVQVTAISTSQFDVAFAGGIAGTSLAKILACEASGGPISATGFKACAGGIIGDNPMTLVKDCIIFCAAHTDKATAIGSSESYAGGLVGHKYGGEVYSSYARGEAETVTTAGYYGAGAIVGYNFFGDQRYSIGLGQVGEGISGKGTSTLEASDSLKIVYNSSATDSDIYDIVAATNDTGGSLFSVTISTTTYDAARFPAYGIELKEQTFKNTEVWKYDSNIGSGKIRLSGLPPIDPSAAP